VFHSINSRKILLIIFNTSHIFILIKYIVYSLSQISPVYGICLTLQFRASLLPANLRLTTEFRASIPWAGLVEVALTNSNPYLKAVSLAFLAHGSQPNVPRDSTYNLSNAGKIPDSISGHWFILNRHLLNSAQMGLPFSGNRSRSGRIDALRSKRIISRLT
jgi:hypothetical protein